MGGKRGLSYYGASRPGQSVSSVFIRATGVASARDIFKLWAVAFPEEAKDVNPALTNLDWRRTRKLFANHAIKDDVLWLGTGVTAGGIFSACSQELKKTTDT